NGLVFHARIYTPRISDMHQMPWISDLKNGQVITLYALLAKEPVIMCLLGAIVLFIISGCFFWDPFWSIWSIIRSFRGGCSQE
ncbi:MAG: hypothetical protein Q7R72_02230, partial [bacterium]|nr:hypothetical protein [bacterium]